MIDIEEWIRKELETFKAHGMGGTWLMQEFILRNGQRFSSQAKPKRYKMGTPKFCFYNSRILCNRSHGKLRYAEGYVASPDLPLLIHHAWCVDEENRVVDVTLQDYKGGESRAGAAQYFGLTFEKKLINAISPNSGSMLDSGVGYRIDLWLAIDPSFEALVKEASTKIFGAKASSLNPTK